MASKRVKTFQNNRQQGKDISHSFDFCCSITTIKWFSNHKSCLIVQLHLYSLHPLNKIYCKSSTEGVWFSNALTYWVTPLESHNPLCIIVIQSTTEGVGILSRILDIIIRKDKTLVCTFEDNFKQNGVNFYRPSASEHG